MKICGKWASQVVQWGKMAANTGNLGSNPGLEDPLRREWQPIPVFLPREFHE